MKQKEKRLKRIPSSYPKIVAIFCFLLLFMRHSIGQDKCATVPYNEKLTNQYEKYSNEAFESWMLKNSTSLRSRTSDEPYLIPVVVHVIHNGEEVGSGSNIPIEQILSQIETLNEDFRRLNADTVNTPTEFESVAVDTGIEFVLALQDPDGVPTDGIVRVNGEKSSWSFEEDIELKANSYWSSSSYFNIWVTALSDNVLGYAQFPISDELQGLEDGSKDEETDGVVVDYRYFGTGFNADSESRGRTLTHEVGHYFGLRHIWGDAFFFEDGCSVDDYCSDTPNTSTNFGGCDLSDLESITCGSRPMIENYMDYTADVCMNTFTSDQLSRMETVLQNSPRRTSLLTSKALEEPIIFESDVAITSINSPQSIVCGASLVPRVTFRNIGSQVVTSVDFTYGLNGRNLTSSVVLPELSYLESMVVELPQITLEEVNELIVTIENVNGTLDQRVDNNQLTSTFSQIKTGNLPIRETFEVVSEDWTVINQDEATSWEIRDITIEDQPESVIYIDNYDYESIGQEDALITPSINARVDRADSIVLSFDLSYAASFFGEDALEIRLFDGCQNFSSGNYEVIYYKEGESLSTSSNTSFRNSYTPESEDEWRTETIDLLPFLTNDDFVVSFVAINDFGDNLYLDNIEIIYHPQVEGGTFLAFPNPVNDVINLEFNYSSEQKLVWQLLDLTGQVFNEEVVENTSSGILQLDLTGLNPSIYLIRLIGDGIDHTEKIIYRGD